jgi:hypothetical protein
VYDLETAILETAILHRRNAGQRVCPRGSPAIVYWRLRRHEPGYLGTSAMARKKMTDAVPGARAGRGNR